MRRRVSVLRIWELICRRCVIGIETALLIGSAVASIGGGISQASEARSQAKSAQEQAEVQARATAREAIDVEKRQKLSFLKSGVALEGSPLLILAETREKGLENVEAIQGQGRQQAKSILRGGRSALIGGLTSAAQTGVGSISTAPRENLGGGGTFNPATQAPSRKPLRRPA